MIIINRLFYMNINELTTGEMYNKLSNTKSIKGKTTTFDNKSKEENLKTV